MKLRAGIAGAVVGLALAGPLLVGTTQAGALSGAEIDPAAGIKLQSTSQYKDSFGITHLIGNVIDTGATVEQPEVIIDLLDSTGTKVVSQVGQYLPVGWLMQKSQPYEMAPFDYVIPAGVSFSGKWKVDHFEGQVSQVVPSHAFTLSNITGPNNNADTAILHGQARNDNGYQVQLIKVEVTFFDASGTIVFVEPTDVNSNDVLVQPGAQYPFQLPRITGVPAFDINNRAIIVEANEAGKSYAPPTTGLAVPIDKPFKPFPAVPRYRGSLMEHTPVVNGTTRLVPNPTASDLAGFAHPGVVKREHDTAAVNSGSDGAQQLVNQSAPAPASHTTAAYAPILLIVLLGGYGLFAAVNGLRSGVAGFRENRAARREQLSKLAPGATGGYGAMPGSQR